MPTHLRALIYIVCIAATIFYFAKPALCEECVESDDYRRRRNLWFGCVLIMFFAYNFWIYIVSCGVMLYYFGKRERNPLALYFAVLFALPAYELPIPGFGLVNFLFTIEYVRLLSLAILLPFAIRLRSTRATRDSAPQFADSCVALYILLVFVLAITRNGDTVTNAIRNSFYHVIDIGLPYYVASRALSSFKEYREAIAALIVAAAILGTTAIFETSRFWILYQSLSEPLGVRFPDIQAYLTRGAGGLLRARATAVQPIVLGYLMMVAIALYTFLGQELKNKPVKWLILATLMGGLIASVSRGPWVGTAAALMVTMAYGPGKGKRALGAISVGGIALVALLISPYGERVIQYIPFVGTVESGNVDYRVQLWRASLKVIELNPWFGDRLFYRNPLLEPLRQGQGIIDIVNTYLQLALQTGIIGLALYVLPLGAAIAAAIRFQRFGTANGEPHVERLGRALLAAIVGIIITIATTSSRNTVPTMYWVVIGLSVGSLRLTRQQVTESAVVQTLTQRRVNTSNGY